MGGVLTKLRAVYPLFLLSGFSALVFEVLWVRRLSLTLGHTAPAVSTILTMTMAGLALGSLWGGRRADTLPTRSALVRLYAKLELFIGLWGWSSLLLLTAVEKGFYFLAARGGSSQLLQVFGSGGALLVLLPATVAMGATLPLLSRAVLGDDLTWDGVVARLYGLNTLGAVLGAFSAGYLLLPLLGSKGSIALAGAVNIGVAWAALLIFRDQGEELVQVIRRAAVVSGRARSGTVLVSVFLLGAVSMACQVAWTRGLVLSLGSSTYAFSAILSVFLSGLAAGGLLYSGLFRRSAAWGHFTVLTALVSLSILGSAYGVAQLPRLFLWLFPFTQEQFWLLVLLHLLLSALVLGPSTLFFGLSLPMAVALSGEQGENAGRDLGRVFAANTLGCVAGAWWAGFVGIPLWGSHLTLIGAAALAALVSGLAFGLWSQKRGSTLVFGLFALGLLWGMQPSWSKKLATAGVAIYGQEYSQGKSLEQQVGEPAFYIDGISSTVSIHFSGSYLTLKVNGKVDASLHPSDRQTMYLTGYLAGLAVPQVKKAAVIGLGSGMTLQALSHFPEIESIRCAEIEPAILETQSYWKPHNGAVLDDPRVSVEQMDGRRFIMASHEPYDLIASEPSNPWIAGIGNIYTQEFYRACRQNLSEDGVMAQWFHLYSVTDREVGIVMRSFFSEFPYGEVWITAPGDLVLLGSKKPMISNLDRVKDFYRSSSVVQQTWFDIGLYHPESILGHFLMSRETALKKFPGDEFNTDDRPILEFLAPRHLYTQAKEANLDLLFQDRNRLLPEAYQETEELLLKASDGWLNTRDFGVARELLGKTSKPGSKLLRARMTAGAANSVAQVEQSFSLALQEHPRTGPLDFLMGESFLRLRRWDLAALSFERAAQENWPGSQGQVHLGWGLSLMRMGRFAEAEVAYQMATTSLPGSAAQLGLAQARAKQGKAEQALGAFEEALARNPHDVEAHLGKAMIFFEQDSFAPAAKCFEDVLKLMPEHRVALLNLGVCQVNLGDEPAGRKTFQALLRYHPKDESAKQNLRALDEGV